MLNMAIDMNAAGDRIRRGAGRSSASGNSSSPAGTSLPTSATCFV